MPASALPYTPAAIELLDASAIPAPIKTTAIRPSERP
jgi:hypothetical protein